MFCKDQTGFRCWLSTLNDEALLNAFPNVRTADEHPGIEEMHLAGIDPEEVDDSGYPLIFSKYRAAHAASSPLVPNRSRTCTGVPDEAGLWTSIKPVNPNVRARKLQRLEATVRLAEDVPDLASETKRVKDKKQKKNNLKAKIIKQWHPEPAETGK